MIIYSKFNTSRKSEYQLLTTIEIIDDIKYSYKKALKNEAKPFLESLIKKHDLLNKENLPFDLVKVERTSDGMRFNYIEGETLDAKLFRAIAKREKSKIIRVLLDFKDIIDRCNIQKSTLGEEFREIFGENEPITKECLLSGCIDLTLDNFIVNKENKCVLIDYEWVFPFPVPVDYIFFRTIRNSYIKYSSYNVANILPISEAFDLFGINSKEVEACYIYEYNFQKTVNDKKSIPPFDLFLSAHDSLGINTNTDNLELILQRIKLLEQTKGSQDENLGLISKELYAIKQSRTWRFREKIVRVKTKILELIQLG